jgi:hypothetical protein
VTNHGKWSDPGVPHKGWECDDVEDLGEPNAICEMCEIQEIRYVHHMTHADYPEGLAVGCVCAENMSGDYVGPSFREKLLRDRARRRKSWSKRMWRQAGYYGDDKNRWYLNTDKHRIEVMGASMGWVIVIDNRRGRKQRGRRTYQTKEAAMAQALDALFWAKEHLKD